MLFAPIRLEVMNRFTSTEHYFKQSKSWRGPAAQAARGLMFVQLYGIHEFCVKEVVRAGAATVASHGHAYDRIRPGLLALFLEPQLVSASAAGKRQLWEKRIDLIAMATSSDAVAINGNTAMPTDGSHYRHTHVSLILRVFGVTKKLAKRPRHVLRIDEVVGNRHAIAHGNETPEQIGQRYSRDDIWTITRQMKSMSLRLINNMSECCSDSARHCR